MARQSAGNAGFPDTLAACVDSRRDQPFRMRSVAHQLFVPAMLLAVAASASASSQCFGTTASGRLENGVSLPLSGRNFAAYSSIGWGVGRAFVHSRVRDVVLAAYAQLETTAPNKVFVYGETGLKNGGSFKPHKTHQNGLSVDLMVPVLRGGQSVPLPGSALNRFGYDIEFDDDGKYADFTIDFDALAELIHQLHLSANARDIGITRVIFEVPLQRHLWTTSHGAALRKSVEFSTKPAWVRHDEHIHVDFAVVCARM